MLTLSLSGPDNVIFRNSTVRIFINDGDGMLVHKWLCLAVQCCLSNFCIHCKENDVRQINSYYRGTPQYSKTIITAMSYNLHAKLHVLELGQKK